jgi:hypothetical protein
MREDYEGLEKETEILNNQLRAGQEKLPEFAKREKELDEREKNDVELHKILENKRTMLENKEKELKTTRIREEQNG